MKRKMLIRVVMAVVMLVSAMVGNVPVKMVMAQEDETDYMTDVAITISADAVKIASVHNPSFNDTTGEATYSYVYFGSYPQSEVTGEALTEEIIQADYASGGVISELTSIEGIVNYAISGEAVVMGEKYRRMAGEDGSYKYFKYEPIKWRVMSVNGNEALLRSDVALDSRRYDGSSSTQSWLGNELRQWLNGYLIGEESFWDSAFTKEEQEGIVEYRPSIVSGQLCYNDKVVLWEVNTNFTNTALLTQASDYTWCRGVMGGNKDSKYVNWWLLDYRSTSSAAYVNKMGEVCDHEYMCNCSGTEDEEHRKLYEERTDVGVCPTVILDLKETNLWKTVEEQEDKVSKDIYNIKNISNYKQGFQVQCEIAEECRLVVAVYDDAGIMQTFGTTEVQKGNCEAMISMVQTPQEGSYLVKAFLMDKESNKPLCKSYGEYIEDIGFKATGKCGENIFYTLHYDGTLEIYGEGSTYDYTADRFEKRESPFQGNSFVTKVSIGEGVLRIGDEMFRNMIRLKEVKFADTVEEIGGGAFMGCSTIEEICLPKKLEILSMSTFRGCGSLKRIQWPDNLKTIGNLAFYRCVSLETVVIPDTVTAIGKSAFRSCSGLKSIQLSNKLEKIENNTFYYCDNLTSIVIPESVISIEELAFCGCDRLAIIQFPQNVVDIGTGALSSTKWYENQRENGIKTIMAGSTLLSIRANEKGIIDIPENVIAIAGETLDFNNCIIKIPASVILFNKDAFTGMGENAQVYVKEGSYAEEYMRSMGRTFYIEKQDGTVEAVSVSAVTTSSVLAENLLTTEVELFESNLSENLSSIVNSNTDNQNYNQENLVQIKDVTEVKEGTNENKKISCINVEKDAEYLLIIVKDTSKSWFDSGNLLYINQYTSDIEGKVYFDIALEEEIKDYAIQVSADAEKIPLYIAKESQRGDANLDGQITLSDAQLVLKGALRIELLSEEQQLFADMNLDEEVTLTDAQKVLRKALKIER